MNIALWTVAGILAFSFFAAGVMKLVRNKQQLVDAGMTWVGDSSPGFVKSIGVLEILAAIGLIVPALTGIAPVFVPLAAVGLVLVMAGAAVLHARRKETPNIFIALIILAFAVFVAWGRFGPYSFSA
ncbi:MAG: DoxX family protein [Mycobacterium sp.]|nr:DoxX family protein [Mycobacterium sp.]